MPTTSNLVMESMFCVGVGGEHGMGLARGHIVVTETLSIKISQLLHETDLIFPRRMTKGRNHMLVICWMVSATCTVWLEALSSSSASSALTFILRAVG